MRLRGDEKATIRMGKEGVEDSPFPKGNERRICHAFFNKKEARLLGPSTAYFAEL